MKHSIQSREIDRLIEDMKRRREERIRELQSNAEICKWCGVVIVAVLVLALVAGCTLHSPAVGESGPGAGLLFSERELRGHPERR